MQRKNDVDCFFIQESRGFICTTDNKWTIELQNSHLVS